MKKVINYNDNDKYWKLKSQLKEKGYKLRQIVTGHKFLKKETEQ